MFLVFIVLTFLSLYPLGYLFFAKKVDRLEDQEIISLSFSLSIVVLVLLAIFLAFVRARFLLIYIIVGANLFSIFKYKTKLLNPWKTVFKNRILSFLLILGILVQGFINFPNGYLYKEGLLFWSSQGFDGFWHISLMEAIRRNIPPQLPIYSGFSIQNYHYLVDIFMGEYFRIYAFFSPLDLYFRFFPVLFSFLMGISVYSFTKRWKNEKVAYWAIFFTYFVGSFGYVLTFIKSGKLFGGETAFWVSQLNTVIANPPHAAAIILLCSFLLSFLLFTKSKSKYWFLISFLLGSVISGFKVSGGILLLAGLGASSLVQILNERKFGSAILFLALLATNFITIKLVSKDVGSYLIFQPWWFIRTMVVVKLGLVDWELRRQTYLSVGRFTSYLRVLELEGTAFLIFVIGNLGMRIIGLPIVIGKLLHIKDKLFKNYIDTFLLTACFVGFSVPMLFLQKGIVYNSIQFMQYVLLITGFYGAVFAYQVLKKVKVNVLKYFFCLVLICLSVPTVIGNFVEFYGNPPNAKISTLELSVLSYLKDNSKPNDIILTPAFDGGSKYRYKANPIPIYAWSSTS